jgi:hypothetical protein
MKPDEFDERKRFSTFKWNNDPNNLTWDIHYTFDEIDFYADEPRIKRANDLYKKMLETKDLKEMINKNYDELKIVILEHYESRQWEINRDCMDNLRQIFKTYNIEKK